MLDLKSSGTITLGSVCPSDIDDKIMRLAQQLANRHGRAKLMKESGGVHIYIASPICLDMYGEEELLPSKMHLAVNADKYLGNSPYKKTDLAAMCMKTGTVYRVSDLITGKGLEERGISNSLKQVQLIEKKNYLEDDGKGNQVPYGPGETTLLTELDHDHPALQYIRSRDFDITKLVAQFRASFCSKDREGVHYRKLPHGFRASPRGRIIFYIDVKGVQRGWQARIMDYKAQGDDNKLYHFYYHPYRDIWFPTKVLNEKTEKWELVPGADKWDPPKYIIAYGAKRNEVLMGYDAATRYNENKGASDPYSYNDTSWLGLTEGPLDAARLGEPFCAVMGKHFSAAQAELCRGFSQVVLAVQNDAASLEFKSRVTSRLQLLGIRCHVIEPPHMYNDFGDMSAPDALEYFEKYKIKNNID